MLRGVRKLPPATTMTVGTDGQVTQKVYWTLDATRPAQPLSEAEWLDATRKVLVRALDRRRLAADVPVGVLLSGGLDSSLLVGLLADHVDDLLTFSIGFEGMAGVSVGAEKADEFEFSDLIAEQFKTRHHQHLIPNREVLARLPEAMAAMTEPMVSHDVIAFYLLSERVSKDVKVVQAGQGADEVFGGYFWYPLMDAETGPPVERFRRHYFDRDHAEYLEMIAPAWHVRDVTTELVARELATPQADTFLDEVWRFDATTLIVDDPVKRVDNMTMAWGLEVRVPFLDHELVELAARMPPELKLKEGGKCPLKAIARGVMPDAVIDRPKGYFPVPALKHVRGPFLELMRGILLSDACIQRGLYQRAYVDKLLADPRRISRASAAASSGIWRCWSGGCRCMSMASLVAPSRNLAQKRLPAHRTHDLRLDRTTRSRRRFGTTLARVRARALGERGRRRARRPGFRFWLWRAEGRFATVDQRRDGAASGARDRAGKSGHRVAGTSRRTTA